MALAKYSCLCLFIKLVFGTVTKLDLDYYDDTPHLRSKVESCRAEEGYLKCQLKCGHFPISCGTNGRCTCSVDVIAQPKHLAREELKRPALRHHIAHFCPNLDVARKCIRSCMKVGKPAFCGKDHICYCGHKFHNQDKDKDGNAQEIYGEFKDMYEKYFGSQNTRKEKL